MQIAIFPSALDRIVHEDYSNVTRWLRRVGADFGGADYRPDMIIAWKQKQKKKQMGLEYTVHLFNKFCWCLALHFTQVRFEVLEESSDLNIYKTIILIPKQH